MSSRKKKKMYNVWFYFSQIKIWKSWSSVFCLSTTSLHCNQWHWKEAKEYKIQWSNIVLTWKNVEKHFINVLQRNLYWIDSLKCASFCSLPYTTISPLWEYTTDSHHLVHEQRLLKDRRQGFSPLPLHQNARVSPLWPETGVQRGPHQGCGNNH